MAAPEHVPAPPVETAPDYGSPDYVPDPWLPDRPADFAGYRRQPQGPTLGNPGPDQGYGMLLAERFAERIHVGPDEHRRDAMAGCLGIALRRASMYGRAPVVHDFTMAFTMWGFLDPSPPEELVARRRVAFEGLGNVHHYMEARALVDSIPEATLRATPEAVTATYASGGWRTLLDG